MIDQLSDFLFNQLAVIIVISIMGLIFWVYLYIIEYSDWFRNLVKKPKPHQATMNLVHYFKLRVRYLLDNFKNLGETSALSELEMITRQYLATITRIRIFPGETTIDIANKIHHKSPEVDLLLRFLGKIEVLKHKPAGLIKLKLYSYIQFIDALLSRRNFSLEIVGKKQLKE